MHHHRAPAGRRQRRAVRLQPLHAFLRQRHGLHVAVVVMDDVCPGFAVVRRDDAGEEGVLLGPKDANATIDGVLAGVFGRDVRRRSRRRRRRRRESRRRRRRRRRGGLIRRERDGAFARHLVRIAARDVLLDRRQLRARRGVIHLKLTLDVSLLATTFAVAFATRATFLLSRAFLLRRTATPGSAVALLGNLAVRNALGVCDGRRLVLLRRERRALRLDRVDVHRRVAVLRRDRLSLLRLHLRFRFQLRGFLRAPFLHPARLDDGLRGAQPRLAHRARARHRPSTLLRRFRPAPIQERLERRHDVSNRKRVQRARSRGLPPIVREFTAFTLGRVRVRAAAAGFVGRAARRRAAAFPSRDVDANLAEPDADLHRARVVRTHHGDGVSPVFALLHAAVFLERGRGEDDAVAVAAFGAAIFQSLVAHAPEHRSPRQKNAGNAAAHRGNRRVGLAPRARRRDGPRSTLRARGVFVRLLVLRRHRLSRVPRYRAPR